MKLIAFTMTALLAGCLSPPSSREQPRIALTYTAGHGRIDLTATITPASPRTLTLVGHPDFVRLEVRPRSVASREYVPGGCISWLAPTASDLVTATTARPAVFKATIPYSQKPDGRLLLGTDSTTYHPPAYLVRGRQLQVDFSYNVDDSQLPILWKLGLQPIFRQSLQANLPFLLPE